MKNAIIDKLDQENRRENPHPSFSIGDTIRMHIKIREGNKERIQVFTGTVIALDGSGSTETVTVRRVSYGEGVERVFPLHSPFLEKIEVERQGRTRRAKLYFLRDRIGKATRVKEKRLPSRNIK